MSPADEAAIEAGEDGGWSGSLFGEGADGAYDERDAQGGAKAFAANVSYDAEGALIGGWDDLKQVPANFAGGAVCTKG